MFPDPPIYTLYYITPPSPPVPQFADEVLFATIAPYFSLLMDLPGTVQYRVL